MLSVCESFYDDAKQKAVAFGQHIKRNKDYYMLGGGAAAGIAGLNHFLGPNNNGPGFLRSQSNGGGQPAESGQNPDAIHGDPELIFKQIGLGESFDDYLDENVISDFFGKYKDKLFKRLNKFNRETPQKIKEIEKKLISRGINVDAIKADAKKVGKNAKVENGKISNFKESLNTFANDFIKTKKYFSEDSGSSGDLTKAVILSLVLLACVVFINSMFLAVCTSVFGLTPNIAYAVLSVFCAPIVEEVGKMLSVKYGATNSYFVIFNAAEFLMYVIPAIRKGIDPIGIIIARILPIIMHWLNTQIHIEGHKKGESGTALKTSIALHAIWNTFAAIPLLAN